MDIKNQLNGVFDQLATQVQKQVEEELVAYVKQQVATIDFIKLVKEQVSQEIESRLTKLNFAPESIPASAIKFVEESEDDKLTAYAGDILSEDNQKKQEKINDLSEELKASYDGQ